MRHVFLLVLIALGLSCTTTPAPPATTTTTTTPPAAGPPRRVLVSDVVANGTAPEEAKTAET